MPEITRRRALGATAGALAAVTVAGVASAATSPASPGRTSGAADHSGHGNHNGHGGHGATSPAAFDEVFQGRRIRGAAGGGGHHAGHGGGYTVTVDGQELHVMRNADGTWISVVNHYETFATPRALARAAVTELQGAVLVPLQTP
jgi:hypothetical protein